MSKAIGPTFSIELAAAGLNGLPFAWGADGTLSFDGTMTPTQIAAVEAIYAAHDPTKQDPRAVAAAAFKAGCQIVSTGTPALNATYGVAPQDEINITGLQAAITAGVPFLGYMRDATGVKRTMTAAQFTILAAVIMQYVAALDDFALGQGALPAQPVTIA